MGRKGGLVKSERKSLSAKKRWAKKKGLDEDTLEWMAYVFANRMFSGFDILVVIEEMKKSAKTFDEQLVLAKLMISFYELHHKGYNIVEIDKQNKQFKEFI